MKLSACHGALVILSIGLSTASLSSGQVSLIAAGSLTESRDGANADLSGLTYNLENGAPANLLGGLGSGLAFVSGNTFLALPDRGPNAIPYNSAIDDTVSYINRFHTLTMALIPTRTGLPFTLVPRMRNTTLLWSATKLVYGSGSGLNVGSGVPPVNNALQHFFTGRSDNFDPTFNSGNTADARFDTESIRVSNDGRSVFISDEYGPYIYQFNRLTGARIKTFRLPAAYYVSVKSPVGATEISSNTFAGQPTRE